MSQHDNSEDPGGPASGEAVASREAQRPPQHLVHAALASLRAADVYARVLGDRIELACTTDPHLLDGIPAELLLQLIAVSDAFQGGARRTLWHIGPELARGAQVIAGLARDGAAGPPAAEDG